MTVIGLRLPQLALLIWAVLSFIMAVLPAGVGGLPRVVNAVAFLALGPGCALLVSLLRSPPLLVSGVIAVAASITLLVLTSQVLLLIGVWTYWGVAAVVTGITIALTLMPTVLGMEVDT